jgi:hypothetical protein
VFATALLRHAATLGMMSDHSYLCLSEGCFSVAMLQDATFCSMGALA